MNTDGRDGRNGKKPGDGSRWFGSAGVIVGIIVFVLVAVAFTVAFDDAGVGIALGAGIGMAAALGFGAARKER